MTRLYVAVISETAHSRSHRDALSLLGFAVLDLGGNPKRIPRAADIVVCRTDSCSHNASGLAFAWARENNLKSRLVVSNSLSEITERCVQIKQDMEMNKTVGTGAYGEEVGNIKGAIRFFVHIFGFYCHDMCKRMTAKDVFLVADELDSKGPHRRLKDAETLLLRAMETLKAAYGPTQERNMSALIGTGQGYQLRAGSELRSRVVLRDAALASSLALRSDLRVRMGLQPPEITGESSPDLGKTAVAPREEAPVVVVAAAGEETPVAVEVEETPVAVEVEVEVEETPVAAAVEEASVAIAEEEPTVPESAAAQPPTEAPNETGDTRAPPSLSSGLDAPQGSSEGDLMREVDEAIRLLHSYMKDAGVQRITLTPESAEITRVVRTFTTLKLGAL